ncbi:hypothetical protein FHR81_003933 [Actinoalloteichus hoggarensis]|uniref:Uncharacterized protein n=1 Tax=Actinoalloteichus hoggarensis TaxID=1470176 RepID=A0A221VW23_9PSEU|nr:DUF4328 domain-containing protein [Actinoalloteichus hoggarensis]ASO17749.1 hypothetical protein AHOG_00380 [Actinoalloteichus hoggarensis]MBB5922876.1 hypothetical protein [Actinoalloteichus hoggarensis]
MRWVAVPPDPVLRPVGRTTPPPVYRGPPSYPAPPRWGLPLLGWRAPTSVPSMAAPTLDASTRARLVAVPAIRMLWATAVLLVLAAAAEAWRYLLLVAGLHGALTVQTVRLSDSAVQTSALLALVFGVGAFGAALLWLVRAGEAAAELAEVRPSRPRWQVILGFLAPGVNLIVPGSVLAELEHTAALRPPDRRPRPSRPVTVWWIAWSINLLLGFTAVLWRFREGAQAMADGVLLHLVLNLTAAAVAVLSLYLIRRMSRLLDPVDVRTTARFHVVRVEGAAAAAGERRPRHPGQVR